MYKDAHSGTVHHRYKLEANQMPTPNRMEKCTVCVHTVDYYTAVRMENDSYTQK